MKKPNFFIVGAAKAGTTSIYNYLDKNSDVFMSPIKEPHYFSKDIKCEDFNQDYRQNTCFDISNYLANPVLEKKHISFIDDESQYLQLFRDVKNEKNIGEISNGYLFSKVAANEIYKFNPDAKIVIILRNPVERAFSHWMMDLRGDDVCRSSFLDAIKEDQNKEKKGWGKSHLYVELGLYFEQVKRYQDIFPKEQILILLYDDLKNNHEVFFEQLFTFLDLETIEIDMNKKHNVASIPRYPKLNLWIKKLKLNTIASLFISKKLKQLLKSMLNNTESLPKLSEMERKEMMRYYIEDMKNLMTLIDRDISNWFK